MLTYGNVSDLVRNADEIAELAMKDALTGIYNRRHFMARLDSEWKRFRRYERPLSILCSISITSNRSTTATATMSATRSSSRSPRLCGAQTRDSDVAARIGGEEFAILLPETNLDEARVAAERLRTRSPSIRCNQQRAAHGHRQHRRGTRRGQRWPALPS